MFESKLNFKDITFTTKIRNIHKIEKKNCVDYENCVDCVDHFWLRKLRKISTLYVKKYFQETCWSSNIIIKKGKRQYVLIKDSNAFMYDHTLHLGKSIFVVIVYKHLVQKKY